MKILTDRMLHIKGSAEHSVVHVQIDPHALPINNYTTTRRTENALENRRLPASACLFSLQPGVALSRCTDLHAPLNNFEHRV